jgi:addiction module HigA family antidote
LPKAHDVLGVSRPALSNLLNGRANLSGEMALRVEKAFGVSMDTLMRMQSACEIAQTRKREKQIASGPTIPPRETRPPAVYIGAGSRSALTRSLNCAARSNSNFRAASRIVSSSSPISRFRSSGVMSAVSRSSSIGTVT